MEKVSSFVQSIKPWIQRKILSDYLRAKNMFATLDRNKSENRNVEFNDLMKLSDLLFQIKENLHLVFRRVIDPRKREFEEAEKYIPNETETEFINNVGLLFHKSMVVRELEYVREHYSVDSEDFFETQESFEAYWSKIRTLFEHGIEVIKQLIGDQKDNVILLSYLIENDRYIKDNFSEDTKQLLARIFDPDRVDAAYLYVGEYFIESGWKDRARKVLTDAIEINPKNKEAKRLLNYVS